MLVEESHAFEQTAKKIKKKYWWKNKKWQMIIIGVAVGVVLIIILAIVCEYATSCSNYTWLYYSIDL